jgi:hypothetical protein
MASLDCVFCASIREPRSERMRCSFVSTDHSSQAMPWSVHKLGDGRGSTRRPAAAQDSIWGLPGIIVSWVTAAGVVVLQLPLVAFCCSRRQTASFVFCLYLYFYLSKQPCTSRRGPSFLPLAVHRATAGRAHLR